VVDVSGGADDDVLHAAVFSVEGMGRASGTSAEAAESVGGGLGGLKPAAG